MWFSSAPLWQQLLAVWSLSLLVAAGIVWFETRQPYRFFWLLPYPTWRSVWPVVIELFRLRPLLAFAVIGIPVLAAIVTLALCLAHLAPLWRNDQ
jgi:hypothetical protein